MLEKFLTIPEAEFKKLLRSAPVIEEESDTRREAYRYAMVSCSLAIFTYFISYDAVRPVCHALAARLR